MVGLRGKLAGPTQWWMVAYWDGLREARMHDNGSLALVKGERWTGGQWTVDGGLLGQSCDDGHRWQYGVAQQ